MPSAKVRLARTAAKKPAAAKAKKATVQPQSAGAPARLIESKIKELGDSRGEMLARLRTLIKTADPDVVEEWQWSTPVWSHDGIICTGESYKRVVKMTFPKAASLTDPSRLFNSSLEGTMQRAIDFREGDKLNATALKALIRAAATLNRTANGKPR